MKSLRGAAARTKLDYPSNLNHKHPRKMTSSNQRRTSVAHPMNLYSMSFTGLGCRVPKQQPDMLQMEDYNQTSKCNDLQMNQRGMSNHTHLQQFVPELETSSGNISSSSGRQYKEQSMTC